MPNELTPEQRARDLLEEMGFEDTQSLSAGDVAALANLIDELDGLRKYAARMDEWRRDGERLLSDKRLQVAAFRFGQLWADRPWRKR